MSCSRRSHRDARTHVVGGDGDEEEEEEEESREAEIVATYQK